eukprot:GILJ01002482.1.p1 GENE.GILJ01002482.1~~GILJ01002482.1.p1  ORF type:complete len:226 (+),score=16.68 GILJ01002482.1:75-680(+)
MVKLITAEEARDIINGVRDMPCSMMHDNSCGWEAMERFLVACTKNCKVYIPVYMMNLLIFKWRRLLKEPIPMLSKTAVSIAKSTAFLSLFVSTLRGLVCATRQVRGRDGKFNAWLGGLIAPAAILLEAPQRRSELAMYIVPRVMEFGWNFLEKRKLVKALPHGEVLLFSIGMAFMMYFYQNEPKSIRPTYLGLLKRVFGEN